jgi:hypothetical protein
MFNNDLCSIRDKPEKKKKTWNEMLPVPFRLHDYLLHCLLYNLHYDVSKVQAVIALLNPMHLELLDITANVASSAGTGRG